MKQLVGKIIDRLGYAVLRKENVPPPCRRDETVAELEHLFRRFVFPDLPSREGRAELIARLEGTQASEALYIVEYLRRSIGVGGDVCEFGVAQGATSALLAHEIAPTDRTLWLFDSFEGLPPPHPKDVLMNDIFGLGSIEKYAGTMAYGVNYVLNRLQEVSFPPSRVRIIPGFIEKTIRSSALPEQVCFAYVDFDFYEPIRTALEFLDGVVPPGGHIVVDDYGWFSAGAQAAVDEFVAARKERFDLVLPLPFAGRFAVLARRG